MAHLKKQSECGSYNYLLYQPEGYDDAARRPVAGWPLLLFLHGADRKGVNLDGLRLSGIPRLCEERFCRVGPSDMMFDLDEEDVPAKKISSVDEDESNSPRTATTSLHLGRAAALAQRSPHRRTPSAGAQGPEPLRMQSFPFVVISPLCPPFKYWRVESLESLIEEVTERYSIDPRRIYAVGEGMGGWAACALAARMPRCLAACVPIGAATDPSLVDVERLKDTPLWIFHGSSRSGVDALGSLVESLVDCDNDTSDGEADESDEDDESLRATLSLAHALREHGARSVLFTAYPTVEAKPKSSSLSSTTTTGRAAAHADSLAGKATVVADDENELVKRAYTYDNPLLYQWLLQHSLPLLDV